MGKFEPNAGMSDGWGSVGSVTFYHRSGACYIRAKATPSFPGTESQLEVLSLHCRALEAWRQLSSDAQQLWREIAEGVEPHRPPFDGTSHISGYNLFVSSYHGWATLGEEKVPEPLPFLKFPFFRLQYLSAMVEDDSSITMSFNLDISGTDTPERYRLLGKIQLGESGCGWNSGLMRNCLSGTSPLGESTIVTFCREADTTLSEQQLHIRYLLLDGRTGYRSQTKDLSAIITLS